MKEIAVKFTKFNAYMDGGQEEFTPDEPWAWSPEAVLWYQAAFDFAVDNLFHPRGKCLVIGSPMFEAVALMNMGWHVTYLDVRTPPEIPINEFIQGDVCQMPFADESFDALSSTCVLCHVGLGRYGDPVCEDGDRKAIAEMARVLKPGGRAVIMFGPTFPGILETVILGNVHRIYYVDDAYNMANEVGLQCKRMSICYKNKWLTWDELIQYTKDVVARLKDGKMDFLHHCYLSFVFEKGEKHGDTANQGNH